jgi:hypothetical protein
MISYQNNTTYETITSFNEVKLTNKTLVLCDIDDTIMHYPECDEKCKEIVKDLKEMGLNGEDLMKELIEIRQIYKRVKPPSHTDYDGFVSMLNKLSELNGKLLFITARNKGSEYWTKKQLNQIGIDSEKYDIHYVGTEISKGDYIKLYIDLSDWDNVIFIDDYVSFIKSVLDLHPEIKCYKFEAAVN